MHRRSTWVEALEPRRLFTADILKGGMLPENLTVVGDRLLFSGNIPGTGRELWVSSGTGKSTRLLKDLDPGPDPTDDSLDAIPLRQNTFLAVNGVLYFGARQRRQGIVS